MVNCSDHCVSVLRIQFSLSLSLSLSLTHTHTHTCIHTLFPPLSPLVFSLSPSFSIQLFNHTVDVCNDFTSCTECLTSGDPICGWCPLSGTCTRQSSCASVPPANSPIWLTDNATCPRIAVVDPSIVYIPELEVSQL